MENKKKGILWGIIFGVLSWVSVFIFCSFALPMDEFMMAEDFETFLELFAEIPEHFMWAIDEKEAYSGFLFFAAFSFVVGGVTPLIVSDDDNLRMYAKVYLGFAAVMLLFYLVLGIITGFAGVILFIAHLVFVVVSLGWAVAGQQGIEMSDEDCVKKIVVFIFVEK